MPITLTKPAVVEEALEVVRYDTSMDFIATGSDNRFWARDDLDRQVFIEDERRIWVDTDEGVFVTGWEDTEPT